MEVCKNKNSGKCFIFIKEEPNDYLRLVTPLNDVKILEARLFDEPAEVDETALLLKEHITKDQVEAYKNGLLKCAQEVISELSDSLYDESVKYYSLRLSYDLQKTLKKIGDYVISQIDST